jgi:hypothetical protein
MDTKARVRAKLARVRQTSATTGHGFSRPGDLLNDEAEIVPTGRAYNEARQVLVSYMTDLARELGDNAELTSTVSRTYNLMERSELDLNTFINKLYEARAKTQERTASITSRGSQTNGWGDKRKTKMPYFFSVLEDVLGLKDTRSNDRTQTRRTG